jgi:predicted metalloprotease with PDZ domain
VVSVVPRGTPAEAAGVNVEDEILAIGDYRVPPTALKERLEAYRPGEAATMLVARRERLTRLPVTFGTKPVRRWKLEVDPQATAQQQAHLRGLLVWNPESPGPSAADAGVGADSELTAQSASY